MLHQLLLYFVTRGVLVTLNEVVHVILFEIQPTALYWSVSYRSCIGRMFTCRFSSRMPFQFLACKLYVNTTCKYDSCGISNVDNGLIKKCLSVAMYEPLITETRFDTYLMTLQAQRTNIHAYANGC
jgi:hypothetical protein